MMARSVVRSLVRSVARPVVGSGTGSDPSLSLRHDYTLGAAYRRVGVGFGFSRASGALQYIANGDLRWAPENLLLWSEDFSNAAWGKAPVTRSDSEETPPAGIEESHMLTSSAGSGLKFINQVASALPSIRHGFSVYVKAGTHQFVRIEMQSRNSGAFVEVSSSYAVDLQTGNVIGASGGPLGGDVVIEPAQNGWYRITVSNNLASGANQAFVAVFFANSSGANNITLSGTETIHVAGGQLTRLPNVSTAYVRTESAPYYGPRLASHEWDGSQWLNRGLLPEEQDTQLFPFTVARAADWQSEGASVVDRNDNALGFFPGVDIVGSGGTWNRAGGTISVVSGVTYSVRALIAPGTSGRVVVLIRNLANASQSAIRGAIDSPGVTQTEAGSIDGVNVEAIGDLREITFRWTANATGAMTVRVGPDSSTAGQTVIAYAMQVEAATQSSSWIISSGSATVRSADLPAISGGDFAGIYEHAAGTVIFEATSPAVGVQTVWSVSNGTTNERIEIFTDGTDLKAIIVDDGTTVASAALGTITADTPFKVAAAWSANDFAACLNGGTVATDSSLTLPTVDRMGIGVEASGDTSNITVARQSLYKARKPDAFLRSESAL